MLPFVCCLFPINLDPPDQAKLECTKEKKEYNKEVVHKQVQCQVSVGGVGGCFSLHSWVLQPVECGKVVGTQ